MPYHRYDQQAAKRKTVWARQSQAVTPGAASTVEVDLMANYETEFGANLKYCTVTRIIGVVDYHWDVVGVDQAITVAVGVARVGTTIPSILTGPTKQGNWMYWKQIMVNQLSVETSAGVFTPVKHRLEIDIKSQRKMPDLGDRLILVITNSGGVVLQGNIGFNTLLKLP